MVNRKDILRKENGLSLIEIILAIAILAMFLAGLLSVLKPASQINKADDAKRKSHLARLKIAFEDYYGDHNCYPNFSLGCESEVLSPYLEKVFCNPGGGSYVYTPAGNCPQSYQIYVELKNTSDVSIEKVGCGGGCGPGSSLDYNYCVHSDNVDCEPAAILTGTPTPSLPSPTPASP